MRNQLYDLLISYTSDHREMQLCAILQSLLSYSSEEQSSIKVYRCDDMLKKEKRGQEEK